MNIDCPHCGVHGSVDDELAGKKLKCPKCSKVFLIPEELLPEGIESVVPAVIVEEPVESPVAEAPVEPHEEAEQLDAGEDESVSEESEAVEETEDQEDEELVIDESEADADTDEDDGLEIDGDADADAEDELKDCSACGLSFAESFLVEIDSKLYCSLCEPDSEEESLDIDDGNTADLSADEGEETLEIDETDDDSEDTEEQVELVACDKCGESLNPSFLEQVGSKWYCALCLPDDDDEEGLALSEEDESDEQLESTAAVAQALMDDTEVEAETESESETAAEEIEYDEHGQPRMKCTECGEKFHPDFLQNVNGKMFCGVCQPEVVEVITDESGSATADDEDFQGTDFSVGDVLKEAWQKTKGAKGAVWGGMILMYLILIGLGVASFYALGGVAGLPQSADSAVVMNSAMGAGLGVQLVSSLLSVIFTAGIMLIGVRRAMNQRVSWKMVFAGFSKFFSIIIALILQTILIAIGFCLLIVPGIYLSVGYALTFPLILEKGYGPWQALEASRKAIHKKWWTVLGVYLVMSMIYLVSIIPAGLGLIWTVPMLFLCIGVVYRHLFVAPDDVSDDDVEEDAVADDTEDRGEE